MVRINILKNIVPTKVCRECKNEKKFHEFPRHSEHSYGPDCKTCHTAHRRAKYASTLDHQHELQKQNRTRNAENIKQYLKNWANKNKNYIRSYQQDKYKENAESIKERTLSYYYDNRDVILEHQSKRRQDPIFRPILLARYRQYHIKNHDTVMYHVNKRRARKKGVIENFTPAMKRAVKKAFGHQCYLCGTTERLSIDHFYPLSAGHPLSLTNAMILCVPCNSKKSTKSPEIFFTKAQFKEIMSIMGTAVQLYELLAKK